jgi:Fe-S cluster assembly iron-binding protein IscA
MLSVTKMAKKELDHRLETWGSLPYIRLQMRNSCFLSVKVTLEETVQADDIKFILEGLQFIIHKSHIHYFNNKKLNYVPDHTGFHQFEIC